jgi:hypothetical protein
MGKVITVIVCDIFYNPLMLNIKFGYGVGKIPDTPASVLAPAPAATPL